MEPEEKLQRSFVRFWKIILFLSLHGTQFNERNLAIFCSCCLLEVAKDPYLNTNAGIMSPFEHGEVFVLDDGGEVPIGRATLGHIMNVIGEPIDERGEINTNHFLPIYREAPTFVEQAMEQQILVTRIKVVDLLAPYQRGGKIGLFGRASVGKTVLIMELINNVAKAHEILFKVKTKVIDDNLNPVWNETFELLGEDQETHSFIFEVYDEDNLQQVKRMGIAKLSLQELKPEVTKEIELSLPSSLDTHLFPPLHTVF